MADSELSRRHGSDFDCGGSHSKNLHRCCMVAEQTRMPASKHWDEETISSYHPNPRDSPGHGRGPGPDRALGSPGGWDVRMKSSLRPSVGMKLAKSS